MKPQSFMSKPKNQPFNEDQAEALELAEAQRKVNAAEQLRTDKISKAIGGKDWIGDVSSSQIIPRKLLEAEALKNRELLESLPKFRFSRWYFIDHYLVDMFMTESEYKYAEVEVRRSWCKTLSSLCGFTIKYGALGPQHRTQDLVEQLGL